MPDMGEQMFRVMLVNGGLTMIKYKVSDLSRAVNLEVCDAEHPGHGAFSSHCFQHDHCLSVFLF